MQSIMVYLSRFEQQAIQSELSLSTWESKLNKRFSYSRSLTVLFSGGIWQCQETVWFSQLWEVRGAAGMSLKHSTMLRIAPHSKNGPVLPIPNMRYVPAAAEILTDKDRDGEPCFWHVEEAGVQWENMKFQSPLSFPETKPLFFAWVLERTSVLYNFTISLELFWIGF